MITRVQLDVCRQEWTMLAGSPDTWRMIKTNSELNYVDSKQLDITTVHYLSNGHHYFVVWRPFKTFEDPIEFVQFMERLDRREYI